MYIDKHLHWKSINKIKSMANKIDTYSLKGRSFNYDPIYGC